MRLQRVEGSTLLEVATTEDGTREAWLRRVDIVDGERGQVVSEVELSEGEARWLAMIAAPEVLRSVQRPRDLRPEPPPSPEADPMAPEPRTEPQDEPWTAPGATENAAALPPSGDPGPDPAAAAARALDAPSLFGSDGG